MNKRPRISVEELGALAIFIVVGTFIACLFAPSHSLAEWSTILSIISTVIGTLVIGVGSTLAGIWWFLKRDTTRPRLNMTHHITILGRIHSSDQIILAIQAEFENAGEVQIHINKWMLRVDRLYPCPTHLEEAFKMSPICVDQQLAWPWPKSLGYREVREDHLKGSLIGAGEKQTMVGYAAVSKDAEVLRILSQVPNEGLRFLASASPRAWTQTTLLDLRRIEMSEKEKKVIWSDEKIERPQKQDLEDKDLPYEPPPRNGSDGEQDDQ